MNYTITCITPTLVGDGQKLSPVDYMVWKDHVNVLDQRRIFKLLAKGPRLDSYLAQIKKAEKLDFASWGGFAQNFAGRRIPFEHPGMTPLWERQRAEALFIPTFACGPSGPYLPGSAVRGALHTALLHSRWIEGIWKQLLDHFQGDRLPRRPAEPAEEAAIGLGGYSRMRAFSIADSSPIAPSSMKIYLLRTSTLIARGQGKTEGGWKVSGRGSVEARRVEEATPSFCEMAIPGTSFVGLCSDRSCFAAQDVLRLLHWKEPVGHTLLLRASNQLAGLLLNAQRRYSQLTGLTELDNNIQELQARLDLARQTGDTALLCLGWGGGLLSKVAMPETGHDSYRALLRKMPYYNRAIQTGIDFPKTRRIVFLDGKPATLPGWVEVRIC